MQPEAFEWFTRHLTQNLEGDPRVVGLVALGSMADAARRDKWSDHDFFVIVDAGAQDDFRQNLNWLPDPDRIAVAYQETQHGLKVIYDDGHLLEFAVFDLEELRVARINDYALLLDRGEIAGILDELYETSPGQPPNDAFLWGQFIAHLLVGLGRCARGESISGQVFIKHYAVADLLPLIVRHIPPEQDGKLDTLDPLRRFESSYPALGSRIAALMCAEPVPAANGLIALATEHFEHKREFPAEGLAALAHVMRVNGLQTGL